MTNLGLPRDRLLGALRSAWLPPDLPDVEPPLAEATVRDLLATKFADPAWVERF